MRPPTMTLPGNGVSCCSSAHDRAEDRAHVRMLLALLTLKSHERQGVCCRGSHIPAHRYRALEAHDDVLHDLIEAHHGSVFRHTGDGMCAVFHSPHDAVEAATAAQRPSSYRCGWAWRPARQNSGARITLAQCSIEPHGSWRQATRRPGARGSGVGRACTIAHSPRRVAYIYARSRKLVTRPPRTAGASARRTR